MFRFPLIGKSLSDEIMACCWENVAPFRFPSNGKFLSDLRARQRPCHHDYVSIPFDREIPFGCAFPSILQRWKGEFVSIPFDREIPFGRRRCNFRMDVGDRVSIPFARESPGGPL